MDTTIRVHKVGTITAGLAMISFGIMYLLCTIFGVLSYEVVFKCWPFILIGLGVELLISNGVSDNCVYDRGAIFLVIGLTVFAMCMAGVDMALTYEWGLSL
ncbi:MAG: hypothetical protein J5802_00315 [Butyrivibrio sp.]|nr:hypothetical protein [Butyrivibrio sp.]